MLKMKHFLFIFLLFYCPRLHSQSLRIDSLLTHIAICQRQKTDANYEAGLFPSQRVYLKKDDYTREDNNVFFTGLITWTLRSYNGKLTLVNHLLADSICTKAVRTYMLYKNKHGGITYNFWQTHPSRHFPNDEYFSARDKYALPDDLDDTAILYLSNSHGDSLEHALKHQMALHANRSKGTAINNTFRKYRHLIAYSTWFGKHMPVDFDLCVQTNAMRFVLDNRLEMDEHDIETLDLIRDMVLADEHLKEGSYVSPHYQNPVIILYHLARLVSAHPKQHGLADIKDKLIKDLQNQKALVKHPMEKLLLSTSLLRFGIPQESMSYLTAEDFNGFYFFVANMTSTMVNSIKKSMADSKRTNFYYQCEGYYWCLLWENEMLQLP